MGFGLAITKEGDSITESQKPHFWKLITTSQVPQTSVELLGRNYQVQPVREHSNQWPEENKTRSQNKAQTWISSLLTSVLTSFNTLSGPNRSSAFHNLLNTQSLNLNYYLKFSMCHLVKTFWAEKVLFHLFCRVWPLFNKGKNANIYNLHQCFSNVKVHMNHQGVLVKCRCKVSLSRAWDSSKNTWTIKDLFHLNWCYRLHHMF